MNTTNKVLSWNTRALQTIACAALAFSCIDFSWADAVIGVFSDKTIHQPGTQPPGLWVAGQGDQKTMLVDVHVGLIAPDGTVYEYPDWNRDLKPWLPSFTLPSRAKVSPIKLTDLRNFPAPLTPGRWQVAAALTEPGTLKLISLATQPLLVTGTKATDAAGDRLRFGVLSLSEFNSHAGSRERAGNGTMSSRVASGSFMELCADENLGNLPDDLTDFSLDSQPVDECRIQISEKPGSGPDLPTPSASCSTSLPLDAGDPLVVTSDQGVSLPVPRIQPRISDKVERKQRPGVSEASDFLYQALLPDNFFLSKAVYTFSGQGGSQIGPFSASLKAPASLQLVSPDLSANSAVLDPNSAMTIQWNGNDGQGIVNVSLVASKTEIDGDIPDTGGRVVRSPRGRGITTKITTRIVHCRFADDGEGRVPENLIKQLTDGLDNALSMPIVMTVFRSQTAFFNTDRNDLDVGIFSINSGVSGSLSLQ